ncbi:MAG: hypothetical protein ACYC6L_18175, partial [Anaerolineae bacterium]
LHLIRLLAEFSVAADAPGCVELTTFHQPERNRYLVSLVNFQKEMPNIPITGIKVRLQVNQRINRLAMLPNEESWPYEAAGGWVTFELPTLETLGMFAVDYEPA